MEPAGRRAEGERMPSGWVKSMAGRSVYKTHLGESTMWRRCVCKREVYVKARAESPLDLCSILNQYFSILVTLGMTWWTLKILVPVLNLRDSGYILCLGSRGQRMRIRLHQKKVKAKAAHHPAERPEVGVHRSESTGQAHASVPRLIGHWSAFLLCFSSLLGTRKEHSEEGIRKPWL